jgi:hypothetical protein
LLRPTCHLLRLTVTGRQRYGNIMAYCLDLSGRRRRGSHKTSVQEVASAGATHPLVWMLLGDRHGDNGQLHALGGTLTEAFGWHYQVKQLHFDATCPTLHRSRGASLIGLDQSRSSQLGAPWPDIVLAAGKSSASVCRWIREQSGGKTRIILLGRPRVAYRHFDLIITTPQYGLPRSRNVIQCNLPMIRQDDSLLEEEAQLWQAQWQHLPRPWTAVMIGGGTSQLDFDTTAAEKLLGEVRQHLARTGGSLLVTTSPRTPPRLAAFIAANLPGPNYFHAWDKKSANPYLAYLALADGYIVTIDSVTMLAEAVDRMKPVYFFRLPSHDAKKASGHLSLRQRLRRRRQRHRESGAKLDLLDRLTDLLSIGGFVAPRSDFALLVANLERYGVARPLGGSTLVLPWPNTNLVKQERFQVAERIARLWSGTASRRPAKSGQFSVNETVLP